MSEVIEEIKEETQPTGMILYTDGSARPSNPGYIGWGFHGYRYLPSTQKKGSGHPTQLLTADGYVPKTMKEQVKEITPLEYLDGFGSMSELGSNNVAELLATKNAIEKASQYKLSNLTIKTDSQYVCKGIMDWSPSWIRNNWRKLDGTPVPNSNLWKDLLSQVKTVKDTGTKLNVVWVKGHNDSNINSSPDVFGNTMADKLAGIGSANSETGHHLTDITMTKPEGYWKKEVDKHPFFFNKALYFNTLASSQRKGEYYLGNHGKDDELLGRRMSDGAYSVVQLQEHEPIIEKIRTYQTGMVGDIDAMILVRLDKLFNPTVYNDIISFDKAALIRPSPKRLDLNALDQEPITRELNPPRIAMRAMESLSQLKSILDSFREGHNTELQITDVTGEFYEKEETVKKKLIIQTLKLKPKFVVGLATVTLDITYRLNNGVITKPQIFVLGMDIADRNSLKRLEPLNPKISVITWQEAPDVSRFATIIEASGDFCISSGMYTNIVYHQP